MLQVGPVQVLVQLQITPVGLSVQVAPFKQAAVPGLAHAKEEQNK